MARKSIGNTTPRSKKTPVSAESTAIPPTPARVAAEVVNNATAAAMTASKKPMNLDPANLNDEIRCRAYELYLQRNGGAGDPNKDWFLAEREILSRYGSSQQRAI